ncbi:MAG: hypothetical protein QM669_11330 [Siphonobacter sp.]
MKKQLSILMAILFYGSSYAQKENLMPCNEVEQVNLATDSIKRKLLYSFIKHCTNEGWFNPYYDKGIVHLVKYKNDENKLCWSLIPYMDDRYKDNPPKQFTDLNGDIILIYEGDSRGNKLKNIDTNIVQINDCLEKL